MELGCFEEAGEFFLLKGDYKEALVAYKELDNKEIMAVCLEALDRNDEAGLLYLELGLKNEAIRNFTESKNILRLAPLLEENGMLDEALEDYKSLEDTEGQIRVLERQKKYDEL